MHKRSALLDGDIDAAALEVLAASLAKADCLLTRG